MQPLTARREAPARREIAPSRWAYRMQRLWLTPIFRVLFRVGLPSVLLLSAAAIYLSDQGRRDAITQFFVTLRTDFQNRPEFMVTLVSVEGASPDLADAIRAKLDLPLPQSSFTMDLDGARARIEALDAVQMAELRVRTGGILQVLITERTPALVWRTDDGIELLDAGGHRVASLAERIDRADLPLVAGAGADVAAGEAMELLQAAGPLGPRIRGLVRMGERRWDVVLDRDQRILLPAENPVAALQRLLTINATEDLFARDIAAFDLRIGQRPVLRLTPYAQLQLRRARGHEPPESEL
jgi:cell division protein FtsQ